MKLTKFTHSCLLVETEELSVMFDPGAWSLGPSFDFGSMTKLDAIAITHNHVDHCSTDHIKQLLTQFPATKIVANDEVITTIKQAGVSADFLPSLPGLAPFTAPHAALPSGQVPQNSGYHFGEFLSHPGDSLEFDSTKPILALPYQAPWGSAAEAVALVRRLKPAKVVPIHDWHLSDEGRNWYYDFLTRTLADDGIEFVSLVNNKPTNL